MQSAGNAIHASGALTEDRGRQVAPRVVQIHERVWQIYAPFGHSSLVLLYLLRGADLALVDTGILSAPIDDVRPALRTLGLDLRDIRFVLNTHGHHDHIGGNVPLRTEAPEVRIAMHAADLPFAEAASYHHTFSTEFLRQFGLAAQIPPSDGSLIEALGRAGAGVDRVLSDGERVDLGRGLEFTVVHTPGHTPGSVSFYWERERLLLAGDAVQGELSSVAAAAS